MNHSPIFALLGVCATLLLPSTAAAQESPKDEKECLSVELIMYSGRQRPRYLLCEEADKRQALDILAKADEEKPADMEYPEIPGNPSYQGVLITLPAAGSAGRSRLGVRKGFLKSGAGKAIRLDKGRKLEKFFLKRSLKEDDISDSPTKGAPIGDISEDILAEVESDSAPK
jgi:hypothetical protein